jgi:hypothetical protein
MSFDILEGIDTPLTNDFMALLGEFRPQGAESHLTLVALPEGIDLSEDPQVRAIQLVALYRSGVIH